MYYRVIFIIIKMTSILCVGDLHIQVDNLMEIEIFMSKLVIEIIKHKPNIIVCLGDVLHTHERLHTLALNKAYDVIDTFRKYAKTFVLVGNHDMINNQVFLNDNHWMNGMKEWKDVIIVDKVLVEMINDKKFVFVPYVSPGRFEEALNTVGKDMWQNADCIFAHQEFKGCKMGAIISVEGDFWHPSYPNVVSGHIHMRQFVENNIYYTGSALQNAFGESEMNIVALLTFGESNTDYIRNEINLDMARKKIIYKDITDMDKFKMQKTEDKIKLTLNGNMGEFKAFKKTKKYKELIDSGAKVVFKPNNIGIETELSVYNDIHAKSNDSNVSDGIVSFVDILSTLVHKEANQYLFKSYEKVVNNKDVDINDIVYV